MENRAEEARAKLMANPQDEVEAALRLGEAQFTIGDVLDAQGWYPVYMTRLGPSAMVGRLFVDPDGRAGGSNFNGYGWWEGFSFYMGKADRTDVYQKFNDPQYRLAADMVAYLDARMRGGTGWRNWGERWK